MTKKTPRIALYSTRSCAYCRQLKAALTRWGVPFQEWDIEQNRQAQTAYKRLGVRAVPALVIGDEVETGFDEKRLRKRLQAAGFTLKSA